ncbi:MAG TPA: TolC family protein [Acidobacteriota bacterium]|nr:TolC family protein [Acidobacteriota bacterium]
MKSVLRIVCTVAAVISLTVEAIPAAELSLNDCVELALRNRASIIAALGNEKVAAADKRAALGAFMPRLGARYSYGKSRDTDIKADRSITTSYADSVFSVEGYRRDGTVDTVDVLVPFPEASVIREFEFSDIDGTSKNLSLSADMSLFDPASWFSYAAARANHASARLNVLASEQDMIYAVKISYFAYLASVENVSVQEEAAKRAEEQLKLIESRFELGSASKSDVLKQKVQFGNDRLALLRAQNAVTNSMASLAYTIGVDPRQDWQFSTTYDSREFGGTLDEAIAFGLRHKPSLLAAEKGVDAAKSWLRAARMDYLPTVSGYASLNLSDGTRGDTVAYNQSSQSRTIGFSVSYNIFDGFIRENRVTQSKVAVNDRKAAFADARNQAVAAIKTAYLDIEQLREQKKVSDENVAAADEDLKITQEKYRLGAATILDLLDAQVSLKTAQVELIRSGFDLNLASARLENAMGKM